MSAVFLKIVNMSISAGWIVLAVLVLRFLLKKAPKWIRVLLWGIVAVRLICPFTIESVLSLIPSAETVSPEIMMDQTPQIHSGVSFINNTVNPVIESSFAPEGLVSVNPLQIWIPVFAILWLAGIAGMMIYTAVTYCCLKRRVRTAVLLRDNIFQSEQVVSPFVLGLIKPKIYLPFQIQATDMDLVIAHEQVHIKRLDHWWKPVGFLLLTLHWFNPLMWLGYVLLCRDIELACDEKVIEHLDINDRADYSQALLNCSVNRRMIAACPLAFGENSIKKRIKSVLNYKKPAFWIIVIAVAASIVTAVCFLTNPPGVNEELSVFIDMQIMEHNQGKYFPGQFTAVNHKILGTKRSKGNITVFLLARYQEYSFENGEIQQAGGSYIPTAITAKRTGKHGHYKLVEYWEPRDGSYYAEDIKAKFPWYLHAKALDMRYSKEQSAWCDNAAKEYFSDVTNVGGADKPVNITVKSDLEKLKEKFPMYFDLDTSNGLDVYIWQMAKDSYSCALLPGKTFNYTQDELWDLHKNAATIEEMRTIVASYNLSRSDVAVIPIQLPISSYAYTIDDRYRQLLTGLFWGDYGLALGQYHSDYCIDEATFDIDGDGKPEECTLSYGPTSGLFTIKLSVYETAGTGRLYEYFNIFNGPAGELSFIQTDDGMKLRLVPYHENIHVDYTFSIEDGNIVLISPDNIYVWEYWGEQGVNSPFSDVQIFKALEKNGYTSYSPTSYIVIDEYGTPVLAISHPSRSP